MDYVASTLSLAWSTFRATGRIPVTFPPLTEERFSPASMSGASLVYLCLHGLERESYLYGDRWANAMSTEQIAQADLRGAIVYLAVCWGLGPISDACLAAGAAAVIADEDSNWTGTLAPTGANGLGRLVVQGLRRGLTAERAYVEARDSYARQHRDPRDLALLGSYRLLGDGSARLLQPPPPR